MKHLKKPFSYLLLLLLLSCSVIPDITNNNSQESQRMNRTINEASSIATQAFLLFNDKETKLEPIPAIISQFAYVEPSVRGASSQDDTLFYVFNFEDQRGFSIIAANKRVSPIIAITEKGSYDGYHNSGVEGFEYYIEQIKNELRYMALPDSLIIDFDDPLDNPEDPSLFYYYEDITVGNQVFPLINTMWGQQDIYGEYCPNGISGCVATAFAQILAYYQIPESFVASGDIGPSIHSGDIVNLDWDRICSHTIEHSDTRFCSSAHTQISALMREIGYRSRMQYGINGSYPLNADMTIIHSLGYTADGFYTPTKERICNSLNLGHPIYVTGAVPNSHTGHAWIIDGYKDLLFIRTKYSKLYSDEYTVEWTRQIGETHTAHINWGWDGNCNGYFAFQTYDTAEAESYDYYHNVVMNFGDFVSGAFNISPLII